MNVEVTFQGCANCYMKWMSTEYDKYPQNVELTFRPDLSKTRHDSRVIHTADCEFINRETQKLHGIKPEPELVDHGVFGR